METFSFSENGDVDVRQLNHLYQLIGWDKHKRRTENATRLMLELSHFYVAAHTETGLLVGFARVCGDPYIVQVLDVITHPDYRRLGIASRCMEHVKAHLDKASYISVTLTDGTQIPGFYQKFGFREIEEPCLVWKKTRL
ncbi:MAG: GNAT family N-acetyltransferase [Trueperaceae bacterium]|nr:GNAT family N-acetyltransferase [Trueperaceae bacterium]